MQPKRKSPRAKFHNYSNGDYFVTICTSNKEHYFGLINKGEMCLSMIGKSLLSRVVAGLKRSVTIFANENRIEFGWQSRFYDHIIRDAKDRNEIANYIEDNITRWELHM